ncbi:uncharacterized protein LOC141536595 [Cotesia typhae]|uniref:uncharacterized protein LOC141536595 n=1 Tax=Cotesia typhae TaxID=2053667 RepID=UPI003D69CCA3
MAHLCEFREYFRLNPYHVIGVVETWLTNPIEDQQIELPGYSLLRVDRHNKRGGGVALYFKKELCAQLISSSVGAGDIILPEYLIAEVWGPSQYKVLVAVVYRPPKSGDFNIDLQANNDKVTRLKDFFTRTGLYVVPMQPTDHTAEANTWIDLWAVSQMLQLGAWGQSQQPFLSSHDLIYISLKYKPPKPIRRYVRYMAWNEADNDLAAEIVNSWMEELSGGPDEVDTPDVHLHKLNRLIENLVERCVPTREFYAKPVTDLGLMPP